MAAADAHRDPVRADLDVTAEDVAKFCDDGFIRLDACIARATVDALNERLERVLRGEYDTGVAPDKTPKLIKGERRGPLGFSGNTQNVKVLQLINVHHGDRAFRDVVTSEALGAVVAKLAGWESGARVAQDQVWAKPPGSAPLVFHRDTPYFFFSPSDVMTVWLALDDMDAELGPLEYVRGSQKWDDKRRNGTANVFFSRVNQSMDLVYSAAANEGLAPTDLDIVSMCGLKAGGLSIHDGRCWHGSGANASKTRPRRGIGIHFIPGCAKFTSEATVSTLWKKYVRAPDGGYRRGLDDSIFPLTGAPAPGYVAPPSDDADAALDAPASIHPALARAQARVGDGGGPTAGADASGTRGAMLCGVQRRCALIVGVIVCAGAGVMLLARRSGR